LAGWHAEGELNPGVQSSSSAITPKGNQKVTTVFSSLFGQLDGVFFSYGCKKLYAPKVYFSAILLEPGEHFSQAVVFVVDYKDNFHLDMYQKL